MNIEDSKQQLRKADVFRTLAFVTIAVSTVSILTAVIVVPLLYNYMQFVQSSLQVYNSLKKKNFF